MALSRASPVYGNTRPPSRFMLVPSAEKFKKRVGEGYRARLSSTSGGVAWIRSARKGWRSASFCFMSQAIVR